MAENGASGQCGLDRAGTVVLVAPIRDMTGDGYDWPEPSGNVGSTAISWIAAGTLAAAELAPGRSASARLFRASLGRPRKSARRGVGQLRLRFARDVKRRRAVLRARIESKERNP